jgi:hypothetical protein
MPEHCKNIRSHSFELLCHWGCCQLVKVKANFPVCFTKRYAVRTHGASEIKKKTTISFIVSVCQSVRVERLGPHWTDFREI